MLCSHNS
jgi:hypothetical protein